jgi:16S rRNA (uracil1498-N3)-methyltransferase
MADPRFYCPEPLSVRQTFILPASVAHHVRVRRLEAGSTVILFDGRGGEIPGTLDFQGKTASVTLGDLHPKESELAGELCLFQGLPSGDKMDWVIEKAVELGVSRVVPISAHRSILKLSGPRLEKRLAHWTGIIESAAEQCGRNRLMQISPPQTLEEALGARAIGERLLCDPSATEDLETRLSNSACKVKAARALTFLVGPEGGWSPEELQSCERNHAQPIRFGTRVLRTETAGLALVAAATALLRW